MSATLSRLSAAALAVCLLALPACSNQGNENGSNPSGTIDVQEGSAEPAETQQETVAPGEGVSVNFKDINTSVGPVSCAEYDGKWSMNGGKMEDVQVSVMTTPDRQTVISASVVTAPGPLVQMTDKVGNATITWDGDRFTVTGSGEYLDLSNTDGDAATVETGEMTDFKISGACS